jgi:hypothetical protein
MICQPRADLELRWPAAFLDGTDAPHKGVDDFRPSRPQKCRKSGNLAESPQLFDNAIDNVDLYCLQM